MKTIPVGPILGINNRLEETSLKSQDRREPGRWVKDAVNVDIRNDGSVVRRRASALTQAIVGAHSLFDNLLVRSGVLYSVVKSPYSETFEAELATDARMSYARTADTVFMSNGVDRFAYSGGAVRPWGMPTPAAPILSVVGGGLLAGEYAVSISFHNEDTFEESGVSTATVINTTGGIRVSVPVFPDGATHLIVYVSGLSGGVPMLSATVPIGDSSVDITMPATGREASRLIEDVLPAGTRVFEFNGRLCSVVGDTLYYSQPYRYGYYQPAKNFIRFPSTIMVAIGNQGGVFVVADQTYFLVGKDIGNVELVSDIQPYSAVPGTEFQHPKEPVVGWFSTHGLVTATQDGEVKELMMRSVKLDSVPASGVSGVFENAKYDRVVSCGWTMNLTNGAVSRYTGFDFNSFSGDYALGVDGLHNTNAVGMVEAVLDLGKEDFGVENEKHMPACYLGAASSDAISLSVSFDDQQFDYQARSSSETLNIHRVDPGKGLRSNWFGLTLSNPGGFDFEITSISFAPIQSNRRI